MAGPMSEAVQEEIWNRHEAGETLTEIGRAVGRPMTTVRSFVYRYDSSRPVPPSVWSELRLSAGEREDLPGPGRGGVVPGDRCSDRAGCLDGAM